MNVVNSLDLPLAVLHASGRLKPIGSQALSLTAGVLSLTVPAGAAAALVQLGNAGGSVRYAWTADGTTPVVDTTGFRETVGAKLLLCGPAMAAFKVIASGSTTGWVEYLA